jgi:hypothetical protein
MGNCQSNSATLAQEPQPVKAVPRLSYTDKLLLNDRKAADVPQLILKGSSIYQRRQLQAVTELSAGSVLQTDFSTAE